ncbi:IPT/TIG domain-containing protein [Muricauda sp. 2012CJ35-5]|uniref:IPT/TIG domain-containing protein n=1 Tax=Flagellimonas spongiicola TaxID=2942208 RepID=A0ABT0PNJ4_9FLAO|nr:IPT/TIG domain-containing protein [Allomuricauda spongiicola]MCL6272965.1 IPT/TIG domain-containing protein [Allomuricauda spongiicola]
MMKSIYTFLFAIFAIATLFVSCSKDKTDDQATPEVDLPEVNSFSPQTGPVGTTVTINGSGFSETSGGNVIQFAGTTAEITSEATNKLVVTVPSGATTGSITVKVGANTGTSSTSFTVTTTNETAIELDVSSLEMFTFDIESIEITNLQDLEGQTVSWTSEDESIVTVSEGTVIAHAAGETNITVMVGEQTSIVSVIVNPNIYAVGYQDGYDFAMLWKNGESIALTNGLSESSANSIAVSDEGDTYIGGYVVENNVYRATVWWNDVVHYTLGDPMFHSVVNSVYLADNGDIYTAGYIRDENGDRHAHITLNGQLLYYDEDESEAEDIILNGFQVVFVGNKFDIENDNDVAVMWVNGAEDLVFDDEYDQIGAYSTASKIQIVNGSPYVLGSSYYYEDQIQKGLFWDTGELDYSEGNDVRFYDLTVDAFGNNTYLVGTRNGHAALWQNQEILYSYSFGEGTNSIARAVVEYNGEILVGGSKNEGNGYVGKIWSGNMEEFSFTGDNGNTEVYDILVR